LIIEPEEYCRELEAYLCRKNDGHLIRIVGPVFEQVAGWAARGIPLNVAHAGIDRYFERYYRKGPRRRPVRIEFCEADVLDAFDDWRRAVGVGRPVTGLAAPAAGEGDEDLPVRRRTSLAAHVERVIARLTALRASAGSHGLDDILERTAREVDLLQPEARNARGAARESVLERLEALDRGMIDAVVATLDEAARSRAEAEAQQALAPFRDRMAPDAYQRASTAAFERGVRDRLGLPTITFH
jgi:hypothetical protein